MKGNGIRKFKLIQHTISMGLNEQTGVFVATIKRGGFAADFPEVAAGSNFRRRKRTRFRLYMHTRIPRRSRSNIGRRKNCKVEISTNRKCRVIISKNRLG